MRRQRRRGLTAATADLLGVPVGVALPLQRRRPDVVFAVCLAEVAALVVVIVTAALAAFVALVALSAVLGALWATNRHRLLAVTSGGVVVLAAAAGGRPLAALGPAPANLSLPLPHGLCAAVDLDGRTWWIDRTAFPRLRRARELGLGREDREDQGRDERLY